MKNKFEADDIAKRLKSQLLAYNSDTKEAIIQGNSCKGIFHICLCPLERLKELTMEEAKDLSFEWVYEDLILNYK